MTSKINTIYGKLSVPFESSEDLICYSLVNYGEWAYAESLIASSVVACGDVLWDIGAYVGTFSLGVAKNADLSSILAVDCNPNIAEALEQNLKRNAHLPYRRLSVGVSSRSGFGHIVSDSEKNFGSTRFQLLTAEEANQITQTPSVTLKDLRITYGNYDFIKLDIEGSELDALSGDQDYLSEFKPVIWAECNETNKSLLLYDLICSLGYEPIYVAFPAIRTENFLLNPESLFPMAYEAALLCAVPERIARLSTSAVSDPCIVRTIKCKDDLLEALWDTPRWAQADWVRLSKPELIARIGHLNRREQFSGFLKSESCGVLSEDISSQIKPLLFESKIFWRSVWCER